MFPLAATSVAITEISPPPALIVIAPNDTFVAAAPEALPVIAIPDLAVIKAGNSTDIPVVEVPLIVTAPKVAVIVPNPVL